MGLVVLQELLPLMRSRRLQNLVIEFTPSRWPSTVTAQLAIELLSEVAGAGYSAFMPSVVDCKASLKDGQGNIGRCALATDALTLVQAFSRAFRLPPLLHNSLDDTQYCAGARFVREPVDCLQLTYGVGDCAAASVDIPLPLVRQLLAQRAM